MDPRVAATRVLTQVLQQRQMLSRALDSTLHHVPKPGDRALTQELCYGVLRWHPRLDAIAQALLQRPLPGKAVAIHCLILLGLYQLEYMRVPAHAAVAESVNTARRMGQSWACKLVNAVLRRYQREHAQIMLDAERRREVRYAHPEWLLATLESAWPDCWREIAEANNRRPPMTVRVNRMRTNTNAYRQQLAEASIAATPCAAAPHALVLEQAMDAKRLPGFERGLVSIQDAAAQQAAPLLDPQPGQRVLDACAAPGGKTCHILEHQPGLREVVAVDRDAQRVTRIRENLERTGLDANVITADATTPDSWWNGKHFERILLDAPCSATGVIRRHPDIKARRTPGDLAALAELQRALLAAIWPLLAPGGMLLYTTCSVLPQENHQQIQCFLRATKDARERRIHLACGAPRPFGWQIPPGGRHNMDGFYYAALTKQ